MQKSTNSAINDLPISFTCKGRSWSARRCKDTIPHD
jgi:hypothetical protein